MLNGVCVKLYTLLFVFEAIKIYFHQYKFILTL